MPHFDADIEAIFDKPGSQWTGEEQWAVMEKVFESSLKFLLLVARGYHIQKEDAGAAVNEFVKRLVFTSVIPTYDPSKGRRFYSYFLNGFTQFCRDENKRKRTQWDRELGDPSDDEGEKYEWEFTDDVYMNPQMDEGRRAFMELLAKCLEQLRNRNHRETFIKRVVEDLSEKETALRLGVTEGSIKGWLSRAKEQVQACLKEAGWERSSLYEKTEN